MRLRALLCPVLAVAVAAGCDQVDYLDIEPASLNLRTRNDQVWVRAEGKSQTGRTQAKTSVVWSVKDPGIARVDEAGRVTPLKSGSTELLAVHGKVKASVPLEVVFTEKLAVEPETVTLTEGGEGVELKVRMWDFRGKELKDRTATFSSKDKKIVSLGGSKVFPLDPGTADVEVRVEELTKVVHVTVEPDKAGAAKK